MVMKVFQISLLLSLLAGLATVESSASIRDEFVERMEGAIKRTERDARVSSKLMGMATPIEDFDGGEPRVLEEYQNFAINITEFALRYIGCQNVHQFSDDLAADGSTGTVLGMNRFVVVRLCPKDECSNYHPYGCTAGYGDFLIPMEDYLETMAEDYFLQYQEYCETCYYCNHQENEADYANAQAAGDDNAQYAGDDNAQYAGDDNAQAAGDDYVQDAGDDNAQYAGDDNAQYAYGDDAANGGRRATYETNDDYFYMNADFYNNMDNNQGDNCQYYYNACENYRVACKDYSQYATDMEAFFQCGEYNIGNGVGYMGPHCRSDGKTIGIGLYKDAYCNEYNSNTKDLSSIFGMDMSDENLKAYYSDQCVSCLASDGFVLDDAGNQVTPICGALYNMGAKCNLYMGNDGEINSYAQEENEDTVCTFIHNLMTNNYDESGEIYLDLESWMSYVPDVRAMTKFQRYALSGGILSCVALLMYSCYLHRVISSAKYSWHPKGRRSRDVYPGASVPMERMHSGIIQGRSRSGKNMELREGAVYA